MYLNEGTETLIEQAQQLANERSVDVTTVLFAEMAIYLAAIEDRLDDIRIALSK